FQVDLVIAKGRLRLAPRHREHLGKLGIILHHPHAPAAPAPARLEHHGIADCLRKTRRGRQVGRQRRRGGHDGYTRGDRQVAGGHLVAQRAHRLRSWADEDDSGCRASLREAGILGQEPVTGMDGIHAGFARYAQNVLDVEVCLDRRPVTTDEIGFVGLGPVQREAILLRIDRDRPDTQLRRGTHDADRDLTAIGDQNAADPLRHARFASKMRGDDASCDDWPDYIEWRERVSPPMYSIAIHGGAGAMPRATLSAHREKQYLASLEAALDAGYAVLERGDGSLDAVTAAVRILEDDPLFNAGRGAALTREGAAELDAAVMEGKRQRAGAVASVRHVRNPVELARRVMEKSRHV